MSTIWYLSRHVCLTVALTDPTYSRHLSLLDPSAAFLNTITSHSVKRVLLRQNIILTKIHHVAILQVQYSYIHYISFTSISSVLGSRQLNNEKNDGKTRDHFKLVRKWLVDEGSKKLWRQQYSFISSLLIIYNRSQSSSRAWNRLLQRYQ